MKNSPAAPTADHRSVASRVEALFREHRDEVFRHTDRLFAGLMVFQWLAGIALALWSSPATWDPELGDPRRHALGAIFIGAAVVFPPAMLAIWRPGTALTRHIIAAAQMLISVLFVQIGAGRIETRFHVLGSLAFLAFYRDWRVLVTACFVTSADPFLYGAGGGWLEHLTWVAFEDVFLIRSCVLGTREMRALARRQAETERAGERRYQELVNSVDGVVWEADAETFRFLVVSPQAERLLGYPVAPWLEEPGFLLDHVDPADRGWVRRRFAEEAAARRPFEVEYRMLAEGGRSVWVRHAATVVGERDGRAILRGVLTDISDRKRVEKTKSDFISMVSHELRTPLTAIHGSLGLLVGGVVGSLQPRAKALADIAYRSSERLVRLVSDILDLDRMEAGQLSVVMKPVELMPLVEQAVEANRAFGDPFGVGFVLEEAAPGALVRGDADRITQVVTNLLSNAAKFSPKDSRVAVSVVRHGDSLRVSVKDQGPGIPEEFRGRIFSKFAQADNLAVRKVGGSGLGLSIAKAIVERHGGRIGFQTESNAGTTFYFDLPEWRREGTAPRPAPAEPRTCVDGSRARPVAAILSEEVA